MRRPPSWVANMFYSVIIKIFKNIVKRFYSFTAYFYFSENACGTRERSDALPRAPFGKRQTSFLLFYGRLRPAPKGAGRIKNCPTPCPKEMKRKPSAFACVAPWSGIVRLPENRKRRTKDPSTHINCSVVNAQTEYGKPPPSIFFAGE